MCEWVHVLVIDFLGFFGGLYLTSVGFSFVFDIQYSVYTILVAEAVPFLYQSVFTLSTSLVLMNVLGKPKIQCISLLFNLNFTSISSSQL